MIICIRINDILLISLSNTFYLVDYLKIVSNFCSKQDISLEIVPSNEDACSSIQDNFTNLSTDESQQHTEWYAYWDKNGEDFVNETWIKQYGSCLTDDLPMDPEELYTKHREQQYHILYWKFVNEMAFTAPEVEKHAYKNL